MTIKQAYFTTLADYNRDGKLLMRIRRPWNGEWSKAEEGEGSGEGSGGGDDDKGGSDDGPTIEQLQAENAKLKADNASMSPRLDAIEKAENERKAAADKKAEDERVKKEGADGLLKEKDEKIAGMSERLAKFEKTMSDQVGEQFAALPDVMQEAIGGMKDSLPAEQWATLVAKQSTLAGKISSEEGGEKPRFIPGGDGGKTKMKNGTVELSAKAQEIIDEVGEGDTMIKGKLTKRQIRDESTGAVHTSFSRPVKQHFGDMNRAEVYRIDAVKGK